MNWLRAIPLVCLWAAIWFLLAMARESPRVAFLAPLPWIVQADDEVIFKVRVEPDPDNRLLIVAAIDQGGEVVRRSDEQLDGLNASRTRWVRWSSLPAGDLVIVAETWDTQKPLGKASTPLCVRAPLEDLCPSLVGEP